MEAFEIIIQLFMQSRICTVAICDGGRFIVAVIILDYSNVAHKNTVILFHTLFHKEVKVVPQQIDYMWSLDDSTTASSCH